MIARIETVASLGVSLGIGVTLLVGGCSETHEAGGSGVKAEKSESTPAMAEPATVVFGVYTTDTAKDAVEKFRPLLDVLEKDLSSRVGHEVVVRTNVYGNYDDGIDAIVTGEVDFMRLGPASFILSRQRNNDVQLIAMETYKNARTFHGIICIHEDSGIDSLADLEGRSFAFGDENSTIGRYLSQQLLVEEGVHAADLSRYEYLGKHDKVGYMVGAGEFDAGALKESTFKRLKEHGEPITELARFPNVTKPWVASSDLDEVIVIAIRESLLSQDDPGVLAAVGKSGFVEATTEDYAPVESAIVKSERFFNSSLVLEAESGSF